MIFHTTQRESSHSPRGRAGGNLPGMDESENFKRNLLLALKESGMKAAELSKKAGLNARAVKDIEEGRVASPKLSTVFALAEALGRDPGEMMGLGPRPKLKADLVAYLSQYDEADQARLLAALAALPKRPT